MVVRAVYEGFCSNCGGSIEDYRLVSIGVCKNCLPSVPANLTSGEVAKHLKSLKKYKDYRVIAELEEKLEVFRREFVKATGFQPWSLQEVWAKCVLLDENFTIVAPTGVGKTLFCIVMALFLVKHFGRRCYLILPSSMLVEQVTDKALGIAEKIGLTPDLIAYYHAGLPRLKREEMLKKIKSGEYKLLITTDRFLVDRMEALHGTIFDNIFVDDVDSFLKSPKNIDKVISLLGFNPSILDTVFRIIEIRKRLMTQSSVDLWREYEELRKIIEKEKEKKHGRLVVTGATLKTKKSKRIYVFSELLGFELGTKPEFIRNIVDIYIKVDGNLEEKAIELIKKYGKGGLVFVPLAFGKEYAKKLAERLKEAGIKPYFYEKMEENILDKFESGEYDVLVGIATSRSPLARGIDLPRTIRYAIFVGVPRREIKLRKDELNPNKIHALLTNILDVFDEKDKLEAMKLLQKLGKIVPVPKEIVAQLEEAFEKGVKLDGYAGYIQHVVEQSRKILEKIFTKEILEKIARETDVMVNLVDNRLSLIIPDTSGYIQASGRTSRLFAQGISRGVSIVLVDDLKTFTGLTRRLRIVLDEFDWVEYNTDEVEKVFREVDRDRELIKEIALGKITPQIKDLMKAALMIVESPTKAKTFARFFGKPYKRTFNNIPVYETSTSNLVLNIVATMGHVTDLSITQGIHGVLEEEGKYIPVFTSIKRCNKCGYSFVESDECPSCGSKDISSKKEVIDALRRLALEVNEVYIATDPDAEGEKIAYDIYVAISPYNKNIYRLEFHEVTRKALLNALANKKPISIPLVEAQLVRRIEDRWLGFELSRKLWDRFGYRTLSAGRVQTPVLGWVIERHIEHKKKKDLLYVLLENGLEVIYENPQNLEEILERFKENILRAEISNLIEEVRDVNPPPPYTTDSLLKDAFTQLGLPVVQTMALAQELFESGLITYHRTDSTTVSTAGINLAKEYIESNKLGALIPRTYFKEGAHECIRPVKPLDSQKLSQYIRIGLIKPTVKLTDKHLRLYDLIFRRFIASQMQSAKIVVQRYTVTLDSLKVEVEKNVEILEQGFNIIFPTIRTGKRVSEGTYLVKNVEVRKIPSVPLYSEGDIIALMKERGIGRPSTYSRIVQILFERGYVFEKRGKLIPTSRGVSVYRYLKENFGEYVSEEVTRQLEEVMDKIEAGEINYQEVLRELKKQVEAIRAVKVVVDQSR
ncbi:MAG: reverse gyrase [Nitrososphaerota archaeon]